MSIDTATAYLKQAQALIAQALGDLVPPPAPFYTARSDRTIFPKPPLPTLGPAGFAFTDPTFGSRMLRVTDAKIGPVTGGSWRAPSTAPQNAWNADGTKFYVTGESGILPFTFDPVAMKATPFLVTIRSQVEPQFSRVDPDTLYVIGGPITRTIQKYSFAAKTYTDILDLDTLGIGGLVDPRTYVGGITTSQNPECLIAFFGGTSQDRHFYVLWQGIAGTSRKIVNTLASTLNGKATNILLGFSLHSATVDMSGRFVLLFPTSVDLAKPRVASQVYIWDTLTDLFTAVTSGDLTKDGGAVMHPYGHNVLGYASWVNMDQGNLAYDAAQWQYRRLALPGISLDLITPVMTPKMVYFADHSSWNNAQPLPRPFFSSTYRFGDTTNLTPWRAWDDELLAIDPGSGTVWRFCHHRSDVRDDKDPTQLYFWYEPILNVSPDGRWCLVTSNWEKTLGLDPFDTGRVRQDVFLVEAK